jgi:hypothetical protein
MNQTTEHQRLEEHRQHQANWRQWGPYLSERAWGTVREDYSQDGEAWDYFTHDQARSRVYRWNEDGIAGISDRFQYLCFAPTFWNEKDPILKERFFGLNSKEGNHGEDVKEYYFYLDNTPTHSYMHMRYKYPHGPYPYEELLLKNEQRGSHKPEYELLETGVFQDNRYFDIDIIYTKASTDDLLIHLSVTNRSAEAAPIHLLPTIWFRNTWSWGYPKGPMEDVPSKPSLSLCSDEEQTYLKATHPVLNDYFFYAEDCQEWLFTENETNKEKIYHQPNQQPYVKDAFHRFLVNGEGNAVNPHNTGTKGAAHYRRTLHPHETWSVRLRLSNQSLQQPFSDFDAIERQRRVEADEFYQAILSPELSDDYKKIQRQAFANVLWGKQLYYFDIEQWLDDNGLIHPMHRQHHRNKDWVHLVNFDILSMPDKWEYPWFASWDLSFQCVSLALVDPDFAKRQLTLMTREWYMHPNGQIPAYEWNFGDVNPPTLAWAAWRVYKIEGKHTPNTDRQFLEGIFHKLLLNFTWWVNRKDPNGHNVFEGGFLGLDNISIFDRSQPLPHGARIDQSDGTAWMGFYCLNIMKMAIELARTEPIYQDCATKFFEHFLRISNAMIKTERKGYALWDEKDGFFYDVLHADNQITPLRIRSLVGLLPLLAVETIECKVLKELPVFRQRLEWFLKQRPGYANIMTCTMKNMPCHKHLLCVLTKDRLLSTLNYLLDEEEFLSPYGIRSLSKYHEKHPYTFKICDKEHRISYQPGEDAYRLVAGGNSNWCGPVWFPINYLIIESLQKYHHYYGETLKVEFPSRSGNRLTLGQVADELSKRLISLFEKGGNDKRAIFPSESPFHHDEHWKDLFLFHEYFHGENGLGLGASHQGWTSLIAKLLQSCTKQ